MTTSSSSSASRPLTRSEWVSTLPPWRRLLATLNWRPVYDIEQRTKQLRIEALESEKHLRELLSETEQVKSETEQVKSETERVKSETERLKSETERLKNENKRLAALESRMVALLLNADSSSPTPPATGSN